MIDFDAINKGIRGSGGGSGGGGGKKGGGESDANTRRTKAHVRTVEILSEGVIEGFVDQEGNVLTGDISKAIYFDQTPVQNTDGSYNYKNVIIERHLGLPDEGYFKAVNGVETPVGVEVQVKKALGPVTRTIVEENATAVRVIMRIPALVHRNEKDGSLKRTDVSYAIDVRPSGGTWQEVLVHHEKNQKSLSPFQIQHYVPLPDGGNPWDLRVRRISDDPDEDSGITNETHWESYILLVEGKFTYPHTAAFTIRGNAEDMGSSMPARYARVRGIRTKVPSNYNPITRKYTGVWDGTFKIAWHNNPAWVFYDLIDNNRYGLGDLIDPGTVDKWSLYTVAQYCDQMIPSGFKRMDGSDIMEPRFTFNSQITKRDEAYFVLQQVSTIWRGMAYWSLGQVFATADMPQDPVKLVTPANVIGGEFSYSGTGLKARHTVVMVRFNNKDDFYRPDTEVVIDNKALQKYGWREKTVNLTGAVTRGQAHRYGKWILDTEQNATETITYKAAWDHAELRPGDIIAVANNKRQGAQLGGRIAHAAGVTVKLDRKFEPDAMSTYSLMATLPDGSVQTREIASFGEDNTVTLASRFSTDPLVNGVFTITGTDIRPVQYRVLAVEEEEPNQFKITALIHDPTKYDRVEQGVIFEAPPTHRDTTVVAPPLNGRVDESGYVLNGTTRLNLTVSWSPPMNSILWAGFDVTAVDPSGNVINLGPTNGTSVELRDIEQGEYLFRIATIGTTGKRSDPLEIAYEAAGTAGFPTPHVTGLGLKDETGTTFSDADLRVTWRNNFATSTSPTSTDGVPAHIASPHYAFNTVKVYAGSTLLRTQRVTGESFTYDRATNAADCVRASVSGPARSLRVEVTVSDIFGRESTAVSRTFNNPTPAVPAPSFGVAGSTIVMSFPQPEDPDYRGYKLWRSVTSPVDTNADPYYVGNANPLNIPGTADTTYYFKIGAYDTFSMADMLISGEFHATTAFNAFDLEAPAVPEGLALSTRVVEEAGVAVRMVLTASVDPATEMDFAYYDYEIKEGSGNWVSFQSASTSKEWTVSPNRTYQVRVRAVDRTGNYSNRAEMKSITTPVHASLAEVINAGNTQIDPGKIVISGETTLADWRRAGDNTKIDGGAVSANTIRANSMVIGNRGIHLEGIEFEHNKPSTNRVAWTAGTISFVDDDGVGKSVAIAAGNAAWTTGTLYLYWVKNAGTISSTATFATAINDNHVILAAYRGGTNLVAEYGRTVIDGSSIKTGTITATVLGVTQLSAITANMGTITAGKMQSADGKFVVDLDNKTISIEV